ncbi:F0F1 ATP synthase assembly protein [Acuticoccus sediminis]|uniref:ATP synthase protein I n=1 Tax=Acuticoccus sediminis TaxID=2184697 RepID=A0A8B2NPP5_9HYPH|nr:AtpZ/AtpI family protein [Acuticoccus sediminis]RAH99957.1 F0F1 ATP synthase assembly protein [Acuticoccus sediminis]
MTDDFEERRSKLRRQLDRHEAAERAEQAKEAQRTASSYAIAFRLSTEFVSAVVVGLAIGWGLDWVAGTLPLFMVVFLLLGFAAGVLNVLRSAGLIQTPEPGKRPRGER